ncbi:MAG TPA: alpha/beta fold hydrolase [Polyangiaceae bacterium]|nr:alpha/beta fold hydrolase [Polyangiaceae bacterium]
MERPIVFANDRLTGVLTESATSSDRPCVLILNAGLIYRAGPGRLSVEFARRAARTGFASFRFDLSGIGDSDPRAESVTSIENAVADAHEAMNMLEAQFGFKRFVLFGLCSGAVHAHFIAWEDTRVVGAIMLDGYIFNTRLSALTHRLNRLRPLRRLPGRAVKWALRSLPDTPTSPALAVQDDGGVLPRWPEREPVEAGLKILKQRGVALLQIFTGEWDLYSYEGQLAEALQSIDYGSLRTEMRIPSAEHLYLLPTERETLFSAVARWLDAEPWEKKHPVTVA